MSWIRRPGGDMAKYIGLATSSSTIEEDVECETKQQYHDDSSSTYDEYNHSNREEDSDYPHRHGDYSIAILLQQFRERRRLLGMKRGITVVFIFAFLAGIAVLLIIIVRAKGANTQIQSQWEDQYITKDVINESIPDCTECEPFSALPEWILSLQSYETFDAKSMDKWISTGKIVSKEKGRAVINMSKYDILDGIIFWVNGSDPRHQAARFHFSQNTTKVDSRPRFSLPRYKHTKRNDILDVIQGLQNTDNRFREQNELLYSLRSARKSLKEHLGTLHVISTDYWANEKNGIEGKQDRLFQNRRGQLPSWLNTTSEQVLFGNEALPRGEQEQGGQERRGEIRFHHDWETFVPLVKTREDITQWKMRRLPCFNSIAAEAVLGVNLPTLSEYSFLASDDMFLGQKMSTADFVTPLYGLVLHLDMHRMIKPSDKPWSLGEMAGLRYSIHLLKRRFGTRQFPYPLHIHKSLSKPLLIESRMMWKQEFEHASAQRFRGDGLMANSHLLLYGMTVERHREALLWSFFLAKIDIDGNGILDAREKRKAFKLMGTDGIKDITGRMKNRISTHPKSIKRNLNAVSFPNPISSQYLFSSLDGYALSIPSSQFQDETEILFRDGPPSFVSSKKDSFKHSMRFTIDYCTVSMSVCWPSWLGNLTTNIFTHFAFQEPSCGDCLIMHLVEQSGSSGLKAFLPDFDDDKALPSTSSLVPDYVPAHLPLGNDWTTLNFSLSSIASINHADWHSRRAFCIALLQRYNYIIASASAKFEQISTPSSARLSFQRLLNSKPAFICINDDIRSWRLNKVVELMQSYFHSMWPDETTRLPYELQS